MVLFGSGVPGFVSFSKEKRKKRAVVTPDLLNKTVRFVYPTSF